jgi:hypothetical protein
MKSESCEALDDVVYCFGLYVAQDKGRELKIEDRAKIYSSYSGISIRDIGSSISIKISPMDDMRKKRRKKLARMLEVMKHVIKNTSETKSKLRKKGKAKPPKKVVTTSWFWNDNDEEWRTWLLTRLGNEADNRQLDNAVEHPPANDGLVGNAADD